MAALTDEEIKVYNESIKSLEADKTRRQEIEAENKILNQQALEVLKKYGYNSLKDKQKLEAERDKFADDIRKEIEAVLEFKQKMIEVENKKQQADDED